MTGSLESLLERLNAGDDVAAELFQQYAPHLRLVVQRQLTGRLRAKFDSMDVVQSVWADLLRGLRSGAWRFESPAQFRRFLLTVARNRFLNRLRHHRAEVAAERPLDPADEVAAPGRQPRPSEEAQADDLWKQMLEACPPEHHGLLHLRREGLSLDEVAQRTGLHPGSVRRILYGVARRLAAQGSA